MKNDTRRVFNQFLSRQASLNDIDDASTKFSVVASVQQTLETRMQESSDFLSKINLHGVTDQSGEKLGLGISSTIASTTDTTGGGERNPTDPTDMDAQGYMCTQTNFDTVLRYSKLDAWAKFPDFQVRIRDALLKAQALDRIMVGFNGTSRAATSNRVANPLLQDVNIGWLQKMRLYSPQRVLKEIVDASNKIKVHAGGDYNNLDALVYDLVNNMIQPWYQEDTELVAICGRKLLSDKYFPLVNQNSQPTESMAADMIISQKRIGGLPAVRVPNFPANAVMVTRLDNLSLYFQEGSRRRAIMDNPKKDRIENYESSNDAYVVEDYGCAALAENIDMTPGGITMATPAERHFQRLTAAAQGSENPAAAFQANNLQEQMLMQLSEHRRVLKSVQALDRKLQAKRKLLPEYEAYTSGVLASDSGQQDEVIVTIMLWHIDVGDIEAALPLAEYALKHNLVMPDRFERGLACTVAEEVAETALRLQESETPVTSELLMRTVALTRDHDMFDEARAKLFKQLGLAQEAAGRLTDAVYSYEVALKLHEKSGVKKYIERVQRELKKEAQQPAPTQSTITQLTDPVTPPQAASELIDQTTGAQQDADAS